MLHIAGTANRSDHFAAVHKSNSNSIDTDDISENAIGHGTLSPGQSITVVVALRGDGLGPRTLEMTWTYEAEVKHTLLGAVIRTD